MMKNVWIVMSLIFVGSLMISLAGGRSLAPQEKWVARYNGPGNGSDVAWAITTDASGNVYVTGWSKGLGSDLDFATIKYDADGKMLWVSMTQMEKCFG